jgi:hypothetical protein
VAVRHHFGDGHGSERAVVEGLTTREVLEAVARAIPDTGEDVVTRLDIRDGWAGAVHVRVHTLLRRDSDEEFARRLRRAVAEEVKARHWVEIVWASAG